MQNIPKYARSDQLLEFFGKDSGAIVGIELPTENTNLSLIRKQLEDSPSSQAELEKSAELSEAQTVIEESLRSDPEYQSTVKQAIGEDRFRQLKLTE